MKKLIFSVLFALCLVGYSNAQTGSIFIQTGTTTPSSAICKDTVVHFYTSFCDISGFVPHAFYGTQLLAKDVNGRIFGYARIKYVNTTVVPNKYSFLLHVYGDDIMTPEKDGFIQGEPIFLHSNIMKDCGMLLYDPMIVFKDRGDFIVQLIHPMDWNGDNNINILDYRAFVEIWNSDRTNPSLDVNGDSLIDMKDLFRMFEVAYLGRYARYNGTYSYGGGI